MKRGWKIILVILLMAATAAVTFSVTWMFAMERAVKLPEEFLDSDSVAAKMQEVQSYLDTYYIDTYDAEAVLQGAVDGVASGMVYAIEDRWSYYLTAEEMEQYLENQTNSYVGIGITIRQVDAGLEVMSVTRGGPAEEAGVQVGDILVGVEDQDVEDIGQDGAAALIKGEAGSQVRIRLLRGGEVVEMAVSRAVIVEDVATAELLEDGIGLVRIADFNSHCAEQTFICVNQLLQQGAEGIVFDVRFNPGGYKTELVEVLDNLLPSGVIFRSLDYSGREETVDSDRFCQEFPMVVLVNDASYSAAEFFAAALQEYEAAQIVGTQTYGKGNFQTTFELSDGSGLNLSIGKYFTPMGKSLTGVGVTPDVVVELSEEDYTALYYGNLAPDEDEQLQTAMELLRQKIS